MSPSSILPSFALINAAQYQHQEYNIDLEGTAKTLCNDIMQLAYTHGQ